MNKSPRNKNEVLRYLGYKNQNLDKITDDLIDESMEEMRNLIKEKHIYRFFNIIKEEKRLYLKDTELALIGKDIKRHLDKSETCILMAVTLGNDVDYKIRYYERISMTKALILDACATTAIEEICDEICEELEEIVNKQNKTLTSRYSPGYGDLPIDIQKDFLSVLGAEKAIGLTATSHSILIPRKSVTAIAGVMHIENKQNHSRGDLRSPESNNQNRRGDLRSPENSSSRRGDLRSPENSSSRRGDLRSPENSRGDLRSPENNSCLSCKNYSTCMYRREDDKCGDYSKA